MAHLNPAVTIALAAFKGFEWRKVGPYVLAQTAGAFLAALVVRVDYANFINGLDPGHTYASQGIFSTLSGSVTRAVTGHPNLLKTTNVTLTTAFVDQIVGTAILVFVVFALITATNNPPMANLGPVVVGLIVVGIGMAWGVNAGYAINPARDFGPRLASWITGYSTAWRSANGVPVGSHPVYFYIPIIAPIIGGLVGGGAFMLFIERFLPPIDETLSTPPVGEATEVAG